MNKKKLYKKLKNGDKIQTFYSVSKDITYTIRIDMKDDLFELHTYNFDGNDVFEESSYKNEKIRTFDDFDSLIDTLESEVSIHAIIKKRACRNARIAPGMVQREQRSEESPGENKKK